MDRHLIVKNAEDDFEATILGDALLAAGAQIVAITPNGWKTFMGELPHQCFQIWAIIESSEDIGRVNQKIQEAMKDTFGK